MFTHDVGRYWMHLQVTTPIHSTILLPWIVFFPFIWAILWCRPHGNHLKKDLAKFGDGNVWKLKHLSFFYIFGYALETDIKLWIFLFLLWKLQKSLHSHIFQFFNSSFAKNIFHWSKGCWPQLQDSVNSLLTCCSKIIIWFSFCFIRKLAKNNWGCMQQPIHEIHGFFCQKKHAI